MCVSLRKKFEIRSGCVDPYGLAVQFIMGCNASKNWKMMVKYEHRRSKVENIFTIIHSSKFEEDAGLEWRGSIFKGMTRSYWQISQEKIRREMRKSVDFRTRRHTLPSRLTVYWFAFPFLKANCFLLPHSKRSSKPENWLLLWIWKEEKAIEEGRKKTFMDD